MSTKIYQAYRAPADRILDVIDWGRDTMMKAAKKHIEKLKKHVDPEKLGPVPDHIKGDKKGEKVWEQAKRLEIVWSVVEEEGKSPYRGAFDVSCGMNIWFLDGYVYIIPIGQGFVTESLEKAKPDWMDDFCYWNNVDPPEEVSEEDWYKRRQTWNQICTGSGRAQHNARRLYHEVIDVNSSMSSFDIKMACGEKAMWDWAEKQRRKHQAQEKAK